jgi:hypothetical protein
MAFWERTWSERAEAIKLAFGDTWPSETVFPFSWKDRIRCPGACALALPPIVESRDPIRHRRDDWLYLAMGLSQPLDKKQVDVERAAGKSYSALGVEFAFIVTDRCEWATHALYWLMTYQTDGENINWGDRFPFGFHRDSNDQLTVHMGNPDKISVAPVGEIRALLFWPYLFPDSTLFTSTGKFRIMVATGITAREWQLAKETTTIHVLLLLCRAGIAQRTIPDRKCLLSEPRWQEEWSLIKQMSPQDCEAEVEAGIGRWHLAAPQAITRGAF